MAEIEPVGEALALLASEPPLTTRSVLASTLLGTRPPRLPVGRLVRAGALFGIAEGTVRTALSRMATAGEVEADDGWYRLSGRLVERQQRQDASRTAARAEPWSGRWWMAVVRGARRPAGRRAELRAAMATLRFAELREGVWLRPANLDPERSPVARAALADQCHRFDVDSPQSESPADLAASLWDLAPWASRARALHQALDDLVGALEGGDPAALGSRLRAVRRGPAALPGRPPAARGAAAAGLAGRRPASSLRPLRPGLPRPPGRLVRRVGAPLSSHGPGHGGVVAHRNAFFRSRR